MKYIYQDDSGMTHFPRYFEYLERVKDKFPKPLYEFAADQSRYMLTDPRTTHDSWLVFITVNEEPSGVDDGQRLIRIESRLLGPFHDRYFDFSYRRVANYVFDLPQRSGLPPYNGHGDLLFQEFRLMDDDGFCHEMEFSSGRRIYIECDQILVREIALSEQEQPGRLG